MLAGLLEAIAPKVDHSRMVQQLKRGGYLSLAIDYLKLVQPANLAVVNEALNEIYLEAEDFDALRQSFTSYDNCDQISFAQRLEKHELLEMRRLAALLFSRNKRFKQSIELSKGDKHFADAIMAARESGSAEVAESLLKYFVDSGNKESFSACIYGCYDLLKPDVVTELAWRNGLMDCCMPYLIQTLRDYSGRIENLEKKQLQRDDENKKDQGHFGMVGNLALPAPPPHNGKRF